MNLKSLESFIKQVKKKYGKKALDFRIELHWANGEYMTPTDVESLRVAKYKADKINNYPEERVVVIK